MESILLATLFWANQMGQAAQARHVPPIRTEVVTTAHAPYALQAPPNSGLGLKTNRVKTRLALSS